MLEFYKLNYDNSDQVKDLIEQEKIFYFILDELILNYETKIIKKIFSYLDCYSYIRISQENKKYLLFISNLEDKSIYQTMIANTYFFKGRQKIYNTNNNLPFDKLSNYYGDTCMAKMQNLINFNKINYVYSWTDLYQEEKLRSIIKNISEICIEPNVYQNHKVINFKNQYENINFIDLCLFLYFNYRNFFLSNPNTTSVNILDKFLKQIIKLKETNLILFFFIKLDYIFNNKEKNKFILDFIHGKKVSKKQYKKHLNLGIKYLEYIDNDTLERYFLTLINDDSLKISNKKVYKLIKQIILSSNLEIIQAYVIQNINNNFLDCNIKNIVYILLENYNPRVFSYFLSHINRNLVDNKLLNYLIKSYVYSDLDCKLPIVEILTYLVNADYDIYKSTLKTIISSYISKSRVDIALDIVILDIKSINYHDILLEKDININSMSELYFISLYCDYDKIIMNKIVDKTNRIDLYACLRNIINF